MDMVDDGAFPENYLKFLTNPRIIYPQGSPGDYHVGLVPQATSNWENITWFRSHSACHVRHTEISKSKSKEHVKKKPKRKRLSNMKTENIPKKIKRRQKYLQKFNAHKLNTLT